MLLKRSTIQKGIFLEARRLFMSVEGNEPVINAAEAAKLSNEAISKVVDTASAEDLLTKAKDWIDKQPVKIPLTKEAFRATQDAAIKKLESNAAELQKAKDYIAAKTTVAAQLVGINQLDFWATGARLNSLKKHEAALAYNDKGTVNTDYNAQKTAYAKEATAFYDSLKAPDKTAAADTIGKAQELLGTAAKMQKAIMEGLPGLDDTAKTVAQTRLTAEIPKIIEALDLSGEAVKKDPSVARQLEMFKFASKNLEAAMKEKGGHLAGAKEYMDMVNSEQLARSAWSQLNIDGDDSSKADSWRASTIDGKVEKGWSTENAKIYNDAQEAFKKAIIAADGAKASGNAGEAAKLFKAAAEGWGKLLVQQKNKAADKEKSETEKAKSDYSENFKTFNTTIDALSKRGSAVDALIKKEHKDLNIKKSDADLNKMDKKALDALNSQLKTAKTDLDKLNSYVDAVKTRYKSVMEECLKTFRTGGDVSNGQAVANMVHDYMNNGFYLTEVKNEYGGTASKNILDSVGEFIINDVNLSKPGEKAWYRVEVTYNGGVPSVTATKEGGGIFKQSVPTSRPAAGGGGTGGAGGAGGGGDGTGGGFQA